MDLANAIYAAMLRSLVQGLAETDAARKRLCIDAAINAMFGLVPVAEHLTTLPACMAEDGRTAGMSFALLRDVARFGRLAAGDPRAESAFAADRDCRAGMNVGKGRWSDPPPERIHRDLRRATGDPRRGLEDAAPVPLGPPIHSLVVCSRRYPPSGTHHQKGDEGLHFGRVGGCCHGRIPWRGAGWSSARGGGKPLAGRSSLS